MTDDPDSPRLDVAIRIEDPAWLDSLPGAEALCRRAVAALEASEAIGPAGSAPRGTTAEVTLVLADDALVRRLNATHRGLDKPTNVLAFPLAAPDEVPVEGLPALLGDVVLARETLLREAAEQGKTAAAHLQHLALHGLLHLLGHDHLEAAEAGRMEALEVAILAELGVADPYADQAPQGAAAR